MMNFTLYFFFSSRRRHTRWPRDWSSDVCSSDLFGKFLNTGGIGSETAADEQRLLIEPDHVTGLSSSGALDETENRHVPSRKRVRESRTFAPARDFAGLKNDGAAIGYEHRIVRVKGVQTSTVIRGKIENLGFRFRHQGNEACVI